MYYRTFRLADVRAELIRAGFDVRLYALPELGRRARRQPAVPAGGGHAVPEERGRRRADRRAWCVRLGGPPTPVSPGPGPFTSGRR